MIRRHTFPAVVLCVASVAFAALCAAAPARAAEDARTVALLPLLGSGLALDELTSADAAIQREVDERWGARSLPASVVRERLEEGAKRGLRCDRSVESCQAQLGIVCDTDLVVIASLAPTVAPSVAPAVGGAGFTLSLRIVDVAQAAQLAFATSTYPGLPTSADVKELIARLDRPEARKVSLVVSGPSGAPVVVDGAARGSLPLPKPLELSPGRHEVVVHTAPPFTTTVALRRGEPVEVVAPAAPVAVVATGPADATTTTPDGAITKTTPAPPSPRTLAIGGGGTLTAVGGGVLVIGLLPWFSYSAAAEQLQLHEDRTLANRSYLADNKVAIEGAYKDYQAAERDWTSWGQASVVAGSAALVVGATILVVGLVALE